MGLLARARGELIIDDSRFAEEIPCWVYGKYAEPVVQVELVLYPSDPRRGVGPAVGRGEDVLRKIHVDVSSLVQHENSLYVKVKVLDYVSSTGLVICNLPTVPNPNSGLGIAASPYHQTSIEELRRIGSVPDHEISGNQVAIALSKTRYCGSVGWFYQKANHTIVARSSDGTMVVISLLRAAEIAKQRVDRGNFAQYQAASIGPAIPVLVRSDLWQNISRRYLHPHYQAWKSDKS